MKKKRRFSGIVCVLAALCLCLGSAACGDPADEGKDPPQEMTGFLRMNILPDSDQVVHSPFPRVVENSYRYGPSMIYNEDGSLDMWTSSPGRFKTQWDWIRYRKSGDGAKSWSDETIALTPTPGSDDAWSVCDPGVIRIGDWYYMGYTSCYNIYGRANNVFVSRSRNAYGPFNEKWCGTGWSTTDAQPVFCYDEPATASENKDAFGAGEPTFVVVDNVLYMYYTWNDSPIGETEHAMTKVATAPADDENWPAKLQDRGVAFERTEGEDSGDVAYLEAFDRFVYVNVGRRYMDNCRVVVRQSSDGIHWQQTGFTLENFTKFAHNGGLSKRSDGHIKKGDKVYFAYAHAENLNATEVKWGTRICRVSFRVEEEEFDEGIFGIPTLQKVPTQSTGTGTNPQSVFVSDPYVRIRMGNPTHQLRIKLLDNNMGTRALTAEQIKKITFSDYDTSIVSISETGLVTAKKTGMTHVSMKYDGNDKLTDHFIVYVGEGEFTTPIGSAPANLSNLVDSDVDTEYITQSETGGTATEKWFGLSTPDGENAPLKGIHLYSLVEGSYFPKTCRVQVKGKGGDWTDVPECDWSYHLMSAPSSSTAIVPVTIVLKQIQNVCAVRVIGSATLATSAVGVTGIEAFSGDNELSVLSVRAMKDSYAMSAGESKQLKIYVKWNFLLQYELFHSAQGVTYEGYDANILTVDAEGRMTAKAAGETTVKIRWQNETINVKIKIS